MSQERSRLGLLRRLTLGFVFCWFFFGGIAHFVFTATEMGIVPPWLPLHRLIVLVSGGFELLGAAGILIPRLRPVAGLGLVLLTIAVTPANIFMWRHAALYPGIPYALLVLRLPFQAVLIGAIWWSTRPAPKNLERRGASL